MITRSKVLEVLSSPLADDRVWVAGSAAIAPHLADDIDLWVLAKSSIKPEMFKEGAWTDITPNHNYPPLPLITKRIESAPIEVEFQGKIVTAPKIQIMFTAAKRIDEILDCFDCSCHAWARNKEGYLLAHPKATLPGRPIKVINAFTPQLSQCECPSCEKANAMILSNANLTSDRVATFTERYKDTKLEDLWFPC